MFNTNNFNCMPLFIKERYLRLKSLSSLSGKILPQKNISSHGREPLQKLKLPLKLYNTEPSRRIRDLVSHLFLSSSKPPSGPGLI